MCTISRDSNSSLNGFPIETSSSSANFDEPRLSSESSCSLTSVEDNYLENTIKFV
jgi:hypothetical protein